MAYTVGRGNWQEEDFWIAATKEWPRPRKAQTQDGRPISGPVDEYGNVDGGEEGWYD